MIVLKLLRGPGRLAPDRARSRDRDRAALHLLAHDEHAAADRPARELHPRPPALSRRALQRRHAGAEPLRRRDAAAARGRAPPIPDERYPTVDVFVPSYNEDAQLLATTLAAAKAMDYPADQLTVWLLDDGGTDEKCIVDDPRRRLRPRADGAPSCRRCATRSASRYLTRAAQRPRQGRQPQQRPRAFARRTRRRLRRRPRAGAQLPARDGRLLRPRPEALPGADAALLPQPRSARAQPRAPSRRMPSENEMFYGVIQRGLDKWNARLLLRLRRGAAPQGARR